MIDIFCNGWTNWTNIRRVHSNPNWSGSHGRKITTPYSLWWLFKPKTQMFWTINYNCFYLELKSNNWQNVDKLWIIMCGTWHRSVILSGSETKHLKTFLWNYESSSLRKETSHTNSKWYEMLHPFSDWVDIEEFAKPWPLIWTL